MVLQSIIQDKNKRKLYIAFNNTITYTWVIGVNSGDEKMGKFKIDKNIEMPTSRLKYPFNELEEVGDSFFIPGKVSTQISSNIQGAKKKYPAREFISRTLDGGVRIWRTK